MLIKLKAHTWIYVTVYVAQMQAPVPCRSEEPVLRLMAAGRRKVREKRGETAGRERTGPGWRPACVLSEHGKGAGGRNVEFTMSSSTATDDATQRNNLHRCFKGPAPTGP